MILRSRLSTFILGTLIMFPGIGGILLAKTSGIQSIPDPIITTDTVCAGQRLRLQNANAYKSLPNITFHWSGPSGFTSLEMEPVIRVAGNYTVFADSSGTPTGSASRNVTFFRVISPIVLADDTLRYCEGPAAPPINFTFNSADTVRAYDDA